MRPFNLINLIRKWQQQRSESRLALIGEVANLVIQQHGQAWTAYKCWNCQMPVSDVANFCAMCGASLLVEDAPAPQSQQPPEERYTSGIHKIVVLPPDPDNSKPLLSARQVHTNRIASTSTQKVQAPTDLQLLVRKAMQSGWHDDETRTRNEVP